MMLERRKSFSADLDSLLSQGRLVITPEQAENYLGIGRRGFIDATRRKLTISLRVAIERP